MFFYLKISKTSFSLLYTKTWFNNKIFFSLSHKEIPPKIECQEVFLIILSLFENLYWWVLYIHQIFSAYELETFKEVRHDMIMINPLNAKGIYISVTTNVCFSRTTMGIYISLLVIHIMNTWLLHMLNQEYIYALGCWCQNSVAFKGLIL